MLGNAFEQLTVVGEDGTTQMGLLSQRQFAGVVCISCGMPAVIIGWVILTYVVMHPNRMDAKSKSRVMLGFALVHCIAVIVAWLVMIKPQIFFKSSYGPDQDQGNLLTSFWGWFIMIVCLGFAILYTLLGLRYSNQSVYQLDHVLKTESNSLLHCFSKGRARDDGMKRVVNLANVVDNSFPILILILVVGVSFLCSITFSAHWNVATDFYFSFISPYNILPASLSTVNDQFNFKLYTDVGVYYLTVALFALLAGLAHYTPSVRRHLHTRFYVYSIWDLFELIIMNFVFDQFKKSLL